MTPMQWFAFVILPGCLAVIAFAAARLFERTHPIPVTADSARSRLERRALNGICRGAGGLHDRDVGPSGSHSVAYEGSRVTAVRLQRYISPSSRGLPISTGWNSTAAASVVSSESASSLPMLDVPGWLESHRLPNAVAVVSAL